MSPALDKSSCMNAVSNGHVPSTKSGLFKQEGEDPVSGIVAELREAGARVKYGVDVRALQKGLKVPAPMRCLHTRTYLELCDM